jgi:hypothetical protein
MKQPGFVRGFFTALGLVIGMYAIQAFAKGQQVIIDRREAVALEEIAKQLIAIREEGVPIQMDPRKPVTVKLADDTKLKIEITDAVALKNDFANSPFKVKSETESAAK